MRLFDTDAAVVAALRTGRAEGGAALYDRFAPVVRRVLVRVLGPDMDIADLVQETFIEAIDSIDSLDDPGSLRSWMASIAVHRARAEIRRRTRARVFFPLFAPLSLPDLPAPTPSADTDEAVRATYRVLEKLSLEERVAFALRYIDGMELVEVADSCRTSLSTIKRRLARAQKKFMVIARRHPELAEWIEDGGPT